MPETWTNEDKPVYRVMRDRPADLALGIRVFIQFGDAGGEEGWLSHGTLDAEDGVVWVRTDDGDYVECDPKALLVVYADRVWGGV
jgi:hypothetical protein